MTRRNNIYVKRKKLELLLSKLEEFDKDPEIQSHLAKYFCVLLNGHIEDSIRYAYGQYAKGNSNQNIADFVIDNLHKFQNAKTEKIFDLTKKFNKKWETNLHEFIIEERASSINSIVSNKNLIAHGEDSNITYSQIRKYWENVIEVLVFIEDQCVR